MQQLDHLGVMIDVSRNAVMSMYEQACGTGVTSNKKSRGAELLGFFIYINAPVF